MPSDLPGVAGVEVRIPPDALAVVKRAAELQGRSISDFVATAALDAARRTIEETRIVRLSVADQRAIVVAIFDPPAPLPSLIRAADAHGSLIRDR